MTPDLEQKRINAARHRVHAIHTDGSVSDGGGRPGQLTRAAKQSTDLRRSLRPVRQPLGRANAKHPLSIRQ